MRAALWLMALFAIAVATALFAGNNPGTVTLFWSPHRIDLSLNFFLLLLAGVFLMLHLAMRAMSALMRIPQQARRWRLLQKERAMHTALLDSLSHLVSGRFIRARKAAELVVSLEESLLGSGEKLAYSARLRTLAHLVAAEGAHALQDRVVRDAHFAQALEDATVPDAHEAREGVQLRRARWALDDRDAHTATQWLDQLPVGASRAHGCPAHAIQGRAAGRAASGGPGVSASVDQTPGIYGNGRQEHCQRAGRGTDPGQPMMRCRSSACGMRWRKRKS
jgi:HemY protein